MITKYKLSDLARDLKLPANDIIDCLAGRYGAKKASAMLTPEEVNYVLEYYTQKNQVDSFDGYFAYRPGRSRQEQKRQSAHAENKNNDRRKNRQNAQNREAGASAA